MFTVFPASVKKRLNAFIYGHIAFEAFKRLNATITGWRSRTSVPAAMRAAAASVDGTPRALPSAAADRCHAEGRRAARRAHQEAHPYSSDGRPTRVAEELDSHDACAEACEQANSYASRANVKVPELNVNLVCVL